MAAQAERIRSIADTIAVRGTQESAPASTSRSSGAIVRIGPIAAGDDVQAVASLHEAETTYRLNVAVLSTTNEMLDVLLRTDEQ